MSEITREQLGGHAGVIEARADSRKRQLEKRSKQRVNIGGLGRTSERGEEKEEEEEEGERPESALHVRGKTTRWEHASCAAEIEAARGGMAYFGLMLWPTQAALGTGARHGVEENGATRVIGVSCKVETYISTLPGMLDQLCKSADHADSIKADAALPRPTMLAGLCGPRCRHVLAHVLKAQLRGDLPELIVDAFNKKGAGHAAAAAAVAAAKQKASECARNRRQQAPGDDDDGYRDDDE